MLLRERIYETAIRAVKPMIRLAAPLHPELQRGQAGRETAVDTLAEWARECRTDGPLVWVHAPSVGESLMAQAIITDLRRLVPGVQIAFTHFSPSAERMRHRVGADVATYLPWDTGADVAAALDALRPSTIAFVRTEIWPVLVDHARRRGLRTCLVNGVLARNSSRLRRASRFLLSPSYSRLDAVGAIDSAAAARFVTIGARPAVVSVTGDARFDQVGRRIESIDRDSPLLRFLRNANRFTLVAGSTWPGDEEHLIPALGDVASSQPIFTMIAPHQPDEKHCGGLEHRLRSLGVRSARLSQVEAGADIEDVVIIDRIGVLADLYAIADAAYVGGGFHSAGLHSIVEPAGLGVPVLFGPAHDNAAEAADLLAAGGAFEVRSTNQIAERLRELTDLSMRERAGAAAHAFVHSRLGAAGRNAELITALL